MIVARFHCDFPTPITAISSTNYLEVLIQSAFQAPSECQKVRFNSHPSSLMT